MKITREVLKQMIAEELANTPQNVTEEETQEEVSEAAHEDEDSVDEGFFGRMKAGLFGSGDKAHEPAMRKFERVLKDVAMNWPTARTEQELRDLVDQLYAADDAYVAALKKSTGDGAGWSQSLSKKQKASLDYSRNSMKKMLRNIADEAEQKGLDKAAARAREAERAKEHQREREEEERLERARNAEPHFRSPYDTKRDYTKDRPNRAMGFRGDAYSEKERYGESKMHNLKKVVAEEMVKIELEKILEKMGK